ARYPSTESPRAPACPLTPAARRASPSTTPLPNTSNESRTYGTAASFEHDTTEPVIHRAPDGVAPRASSPLRVLRPGPAGAGRGLCLAARQGPHRLGRGAGRLHRGRALLQGGDRQGQRRVRGRVRGA